MHDPDDPEDPEDRTPQAPWWQSRALLLSLATLCVGLTVTSWVLYSSNAERGLEIAALKARIESGPLKAPSQIRSIKVKPNRSGPGRPPQIVLQRPDPPELVELYIDASFARPRTFRVLVDRRDQGRAGVIYNLSRDSNGELRLAINSSTLHPGIYEMSIEGLVNRRSPVPLGWIAVKVLW